MQPGRVEKQVTDEVRARQEPHRASAHPDDGVSEPEACGTDGLRGGDRGVLAEQDVGEVRRTETPGR